jgi:TolA-binding protein
VIRRLGTAWLLAVVAAMAGCGNVGTLADRYRAEQMLWTAQRAETAARLGGAKPDSVQLLRLREGYSKIGKTIKPPYLRGTSESERKVGRELLQVVGTAELQAARLAVQAGEPQLALDEMKRVMAMAEGDTALQRQADFFRVGTLRQFHRHEEAIALMHEMLERYQPMPPPRFQSEDPILSIPEATVRLYREAGDTENARKEIDFALNYYRAILSKPIDPLLEAQALVRLMRVELEQQNWDAAFQSLDRLESLVKRTPGLAELMPELQFSRARLLAATKKDPTEAIALMDRVQVDYPESPFGARALFEAGVLLERIGKKQEALDRYRAVATKYSNRLDVAPVAAFRRGMLEEQTGNWEAAKNTLESLPVQYPLSEAAVEAPMAVVKRYVRLGNKDAAEAALVKAVETYRGLIARDTTTSWGAIYRWAMARCQMAQGDWGGALETVDEMSKRDIGHPALGQALLEAAGTANRHNQKDRARKYLELFLNTYPKSPVVPDVRRELGRLEDALAKAGGAGGAKEKSSTTP